LEGIIVYCSSRNTFIQTKISSTPAAYSSACHYYTCSALKWFLVIAKYYPKTQQQRHWEPDIGYRRMGLGRAALNSFSAYIRVQTFGKISAGIHEFWVFSEVADIIDFG
jgi:hypothetical protein